MSTADSVKRFSSEASASQFNRTTVSSRRETDSIAKNGTEPQGPHAGPPTVKYCVITSVRDEEAHVADTIASVLKQSIAPTEWVIVDDGSTDATFEILSARAKGHPWIRVLRRPNRGYRSTGGGIQAFLDAYKDLCFQSWEYLVSLDGDVTFAPDYFERCFQEFSNEPSLGIGGGTVLTRIGHSWKVEPAPCFHVRGATKIYRRECFEALGGLWPGLGWDTVDEVKANQLGWRTRTFRDIQLFHHRMTGDAWGTWGCAMLDGEADYILDYHPLFFGLKCLRHLFLPPLVLRGLGVACGYLRSAARRTPQVPDRTLRAYLRRQQLRRILGMSSIWR